MLSSSSAAEYAGGPPYLEGVVGRSIATAVALGGASEGLCIDAMLSRGSGLISIWDEIVSIAQDQAKVKFRQRLEDNFGRAIVVVVMYLSGGLGAFAC